MKTNSDVNNQTAMEVFDALRAFTLPFVSAVYGVIDEASGTLLGSGSFLKACDSTLILTAGHVAYEAASFNGIVHSTANDKAPKLVSSHIGISTPVTDLGFIRLDSDALASTYRRFLTCDLLAESSAGIEDDWLFIHGFPGAKSRFVSLLQAVHSTSLPFGTVASPRGSSYEWFDPALHMAVEYSPIGWKASDDSADFIQPFGMSGAAVWKANCSGKTKSDWGPQDARIVGIAFAWDQKGNSIVATRIEAIRSFLLQCLREENAYFHWERRGRPLGDELTDWLAAEKAIPVLF